jgi:cyanate permease
MSVSMFAFGLVVAALPSGIPKVTAIWFSGPRLGITNAFLNVAGSLGAMVGLMLSATVLSPWLGGWERVLFLFGAPAVIIGLLWLFTGRESPHGGITPQPYTGVPFKQAVLKVIRFKEVWIIGLIAAMYWASNMGLNGYLPLYLREIGWTPVASDGLVTAITGVGMIGGIPMVLLSDRWHSRRKIIVLSLVLMTTNLVIMPWLDGTPLWVLLLVCGFLRSAASTLFSVAILEIKGVGSTYSGTASGLMSAIGMGGAFIGPPLGNALAEINPGYPFYFWAFLNALGLIGCIFFKEYHWKENTSVQAENTY